MADDAFEHYGTQTQGEEDRAAYDSIMRRGGGAGDPAQINPAVTMIDDPAGGIQLVDPALVQGHNRTVAGAIKYGTQAVTEVATQPVGGAVDAVNNNITAPTDFLGWAFGDDSAAGRFTKHVGESMPQLPTMHQPKTIPGSIARGVGQFGTEFLMMKKWAAATKIGAGLNATRTGAAALDFLVGAVANTAASDPKGERLSNFLNRVPLLKQVVPDWLNNDPNDPAALSRVKTAIEGAGLGLITEPLLWAIRAGAAQRPFQRWAQRQIARREAKKAGGATAEVTIPPGGAEEGAAPGAGGAQGGAQPELDPWDQPLGPGDLDALGSDEGPLVFRDTDKRGDRMRRAYQRIHESEVRRQTREIDPEDFLGPDTGVPLADQIKARRAEMAKEMKAAEGAVKRGKGMTLLSRVRALGGINPKSAAADYDIREDFHQAGLLGALNPKGKGLDDITMSLIEAGDVPEGTTSDEVLQMLKAKKLSLKGATTAGDLEALRIAHGDEEQIIGKLEKQAADEAAANEHYMTWGDSGIYMNMQRIDSQEDVKRALRNGIELTREAIDAARGGAKRTWMDVDEALAKYGPTLEDALGRRRGAADDLEMQAIRDFLMSTLDQAVQLGRIARENPSPRNHYMFRRGWAIFGAMLVEAKAASTATARGMAIMRRVVGSNLEKARMIHRMVSEGEGSTTDMINQLLKVADNDEPGALVSLAQATQGGMRETTPFRGFLDYWTSGLLWSPKTHVTNITTNEGRNLWGIAETTLSAAMTDLTQNPNGVSWQEASAHLYGTIKGHEAMFRLGYQALREGRHFEPFKLDPKVDAAIGMASKWQIQPQFTATTFGVDPKGAFGRSIDFMGKTQRISANLLTTEDQFAKGINFIAELRKDAARTAYNEGLEGEAWGARVGELTNNPQPEAIERAWKLAESDTFTQQSDWIGRAYEDFADKVPALKILTPFVRFSNNALKFTFEGTPLALISRNVRADIAAGGPRAQTAYARMAMGTGVMLWACDMVMNGTLVGGMGVDSAEADSRQRQDIPRYSIKFGDQRFSLARLAPFAMWMGMAADVCEIVKHVDTEEADHIVTAFGMATAYNLRSQTFLTGVFKMNEAVMDPPNKMGQWAREFGDTLIPMSALVRNVGGALDPVRRDENAYVEGDPISEYLHHELNHVMETVGLGKVAGLPPDRNLWGKPHTRASNIAGKGAFLSTMYDLVSPLYSMRESKDPVEKAMVANGVDIEMPKRALMVNGVGVRLKPEEYSEFVRLAGEPAYKELQQLVHSPEYAASPHGPGTFMSHRMEAIIRQNRRAAKAPGGPLQAAFPDLSSRMSAASQKAQALQMGQ